MKSLSQSQFKLAAIQAEEVLFRRSFGSHKQARILVATAVDDWAKKVEDYFAKGGTNIKAIVDWLKNGQFKEEAAPGGVKYTRSDCNFSFTSNGKTVSVKPLPAGGEKGTKEGPEKKEEAPGKAKPKAKPTPKKPANTGEMFDQIKKLQSEGGDRDQIRQMMYNYSVARAKEDKAAGKAPGDYYAELSHDKRPGSDKPSGVGRDAQSEATQALFTKVNANQITSKNAKEALGILEKLGFKGSKSETGVFIYSKEGSPYMFKWDNNEGQMTARELKKSASRIISARRIIATGHI